MHGLDTSNVSSRVESSRAKWNLSHIAWVWNGIGGWAKRWKVIAESDGRRADGPDCDAACPNLQRDSSNE